MDNESTLQAALPGYEIGEELGRGAFGTVVAARHRQLGRNVAVKLLTPGLVTSDAVRERFHSEARVLAAIDHPHVVPVYDYVEYDDSCILVMERLGGGTVWQRFVEQGLDQKTACAIALTVCSGLHGAHRHGVLHRDMKPENVLFGDDHVLKVGDFGIARVLGEDDTLATRGGELLGTPAYMAPEQAKGAELGPATDVYATGVMLYELLSGSLPFPDEGGALSVVLRHVNEDPRPLRDVAPSTPAVLADAVMRALARDPDDRFESAEAFGIAVGDSASMAWGTSWLSATGIELREPGAILDAAHHGALHGAAQTAGANEVVHPTIELHTGGGAPQDVAITDLLPLRSTPIEMPTRPTLSAGLGIALALLALLLAFVGVGGASPAPQLTSGVVSIAGADPTTGSVHANLDQRIPIVVHRPPAGLGASPTAQLLFSIAGLTVVRSTTVPLSNVDGSLTGAVDASIGRYIVGGKLSGELVLSGRRSVTDSFAFAAARAPIATFAGVVGIVLILVVLAYTESLLRTLRLGRRRDKLGAVIGLVIVGAIGGASTSLWGWLLGLTRPGPVGVIITALLGACAGLLAGFAGRRLGERARVHRRSNRLVLVAKRSSPLASDSAPVGIA